MKSIKNKGLLVAGALVLSALYILSDEDDPFTVTFTLDALPRVLRDKIALFADGILITATRISKNSDFTIHPLTDKEFEGIVMNRLRDAFGLREKWNRN